QRTSVEAMTVCITGEERNPMRKPLGQGRLKAVVVGIGAVRSLVDKVQVRKLGGVRTDARCEIDLIDVTKEKQPFADICDIANLQRDIVGEGVLHSKVPARDVGHFEIRVYRHQVARYCSRATEEGTGRKNNTIPVERRGRVTGVGEQVGSPKGLRTRRPDGYSDCAGAGRVGGDAGSSAVLEPELRNKSARGERRIHHTTAGPDYGCPLARDIPGQTKAWREVFAVGMYESIANGWLTLLNHSQRRIEVSPKVVDLSIRRLVGVAQAQIEH